MQYPNLPSRFAWLANVEELPKIVDQALRWLGTKETPGEASNPVIMAWAAAVGAYFGLKDKRTYYPSDLTPWCALFVTYLFLMAGKPRPGDPLAAKNWATAGDRVARKEDLVLGDLVVFAHHVAIFIAHTPNGGALLGGNQGDKVGIDDFRLDAAIAFRRPKYTQRPKGARRFDVTAQGLAAPVKIV